MWKYVKVVLGIILMLAAVGGMKALFSGALEKSARRIVENGADTMGTIEKRTQHFVAGRLGKVGGVGFYYSIEYSFRAQDGRKYAKEINVSKEQAYALSDGQQIRVRYMKNQPTINSAVDFKEYMTEKDIKELPFGMILTMSILSFFGGAWLTWSSWSRFRPAPKARYATGNATTRVQSMASNRPSQPRGLARPGARPAFGRH